MVRRLDVRRSPEHGCHSPDVRVVLSAVLCPHLASLLQALLTILDSPLNKAGKIKVRCCCCCCSSSASLCFLCCSWTWFCWVELFPSCSCYLVLACLHALE